MGPIKVENVIVASHLGKKLELVKLATEIPNARYSSSGNPSVIIEVDMSSSKFIGSKRLKAAARNERVLIVESKYIKKFWKTAKSLTKFCKKKYIKN